MLQQWVVKSVLLAAYALPVSNRNRADRTALLRANKRICGIDSPSKDSITKTNELLIYWKQLRRVKPARWAAFSTHAAASAAAEYSNLQ